MESEIPYLDPIIIDANHLRREAVKRRKPYDELSIDPEAQARYETEGWQFEKRLKRVSKLRREKQLSERLENRFWMLLFKLGYPEMSGGRNFQIKIERKGAEPLQKQVDVFAKDHETVIVAECKTAERVARKSLQKDIEEFANLKGPIANSIRAHYGAGSKLKVIWIFVTENIIWSDPDKERAAGEQIRIITEKELRYYAQIAEHLGAAARYQFLAEFLKDQPIPGLAGVSVSAIRGKLGGRKFYSFVCTPRHLLKIAFVNHRSLNDPEGAPTYQRLISKGRLREIGEYIKVGGFFPNNVLINFTRAVKFEKIGNEEQTDAVFGNLFLPDRYRSAWIIDGQHRLYGFSSAGDDHLDDNMIVIAFEGLPKAEEANLFVTINHEQKSVPKHLLDDLEGELKWGSENPSERIGAIASRLINILNSDVGEPFYNRITRQGIPSTDTTCLTIPAIKDALRRSGLLGIAVLKDNHYEFGPLCGSDDSKSLDRARNAVNLYFNRVRNANLVHWEKGREGVLCTNVAVQAFLLLFGTLIKYWEANTAADARDMSTDDILLELEEYMAPITEFLEHADDAGIREAFHVPFGSGGPPEYYFRLCEMIKKKFPDFNPEGMADWEAEQSEDKILTADRKLKELVVEMQKAIFDTFKKIYGSDRDAYWDKGIPDKKIKADAYGRSLDDDGDDRLPLEAYLDIVDLKRIVEHRQNWPTFKPLFNIPEPGEKGVAKNVSWMDRINELRRIPAHPSEKRLYKVSDFDYIDFIHDEFFQRHNGLKNSDGRVLLETPIISAEEHSSKPHESA